MRRRALVLAIALALDLTLGEPPSRVHPVVGLGRAIARADGTLARGPAGSLARGLALAVFFPVAAGSSAFALARGLKMFPAVLAVLSEAVLLKPAFAVRALFAHAATVEDALRRGALDDARSAAAMMVSRDTSALDVTLVGSAAIESLSENLSDSVVAPWLWYMAGGLPAAWGYRAVNTLDAIVGYRARGAAGMPSARLDDALNLVPARITAVAVAAGSRDRGAAWRGALADHAATPSPNSGWPMAAMAHALGVRLEKPGHHVLNSAGRPPTEGDIKVAIEIASLALVAVAAALGLWAGLAPSRPTSGAFA